MLIADEPTTALDVVAVMYLGRIVELADKRPATTWRASNGGRAAMLGSSPDLGRASG
jgi:hypothetical protein